MSAAVVPGAKFCATMVYEPPIPLTLIPGVAELTLVWLFTTLLEPPKALDIAATRRSLAGPVGGRFRATTPPTSRPGFGF
jgi:hypothetical protein